MIVKIAEGWRQILQTEFDKTYFSELANTVKTEYLNNKCYPKAGQIFAAFDLCSLKDLKVVIIGQDPYHGPGQAHGLCFSVDDNVQHPPSLINIFKEVERDLNISYAQSGNLERWAKQGVLLLNSTLTVRAHHAGSHQKIGWEKFTDAVISKISSEKKQVVFMLWGGFAKKKGAKIDRSKHCILESGHPSPLSANRGYWFGNKHFSQANFYLENLDISTIKW